MADIEWKLGPSFSQEYQSALLFESRETSAIDYPSSFSLLNKSTGKWLKQFGHIIYFSKNISRGFVLYFADESLNIINLYVVDKRKVFEIHLPPGRFLAALHQSKEMYPEDLFEEPVAHGSIVLLKYNYQNRKYKTKMVSGVIKIDINQYAR